MTRLVNWLRRWQTAISLPLVIVSVTVLVLWLRADDRRDERRERGRFAVEAMRADHEICTGQNDLRATVAALALTLSQRSSGDGMPPQIVAPPNADPALEDVVRQINALLAAGDPRAVEEAVTEQLAPIDCPPLPR